MRVRGVGAPRALGRVTSGTSSLVGPALKERFELNALRLWQSLDPTSDAPPKSGDRPLDTPLDGALRNPVLHAKISERGSLDQAMPQQLAGMLAQVPLRVDRELAQSCDGRVDGGEFGLSHPFSLQQRVIEKHRPEADGGVRTPKHVDHAASGDDMHPRQDLRHGGRPTTAKPETEPKEHLLADVLDEIGRRAQAPQSTSDGMLYRGDEQSSRRIDGDGVTAASGVPVLHEQFTIHHGDSGVPGLRRAGLKMVLIVCRRIVGTPQDSGVSKSGASAPPPFGGVLRELRRAKYLSQEDLADLSLLHRTYIGSVERGERNPTLLSVNRMLVALDVTWAEFGARVTSARRRRAR